MTKDRNFTNNGSDKSLPLPLLSGGSIVWETSTPVSNLADKEQIISEDEFLFEQICEQKAFDHSGEDNDVKGFECSMPEFEQILELDCIIEDMPPYKKKQFLFLHNIVNSSSDDSHFNASDDDSIDSLPSAPVMKDMNTYQFELLETPMPLINTDNFIGDTDLLLRDMLLMPRLVDYSVPKSVKHLLCTDENLMGLCDSITLERVVRRKSLSDIIPMSSRGTRTFLPLRIDFSPSHSSQKNVTDISSFIRKLSENFQQRIGSFFNTDFKFSYIFQDGKYNITYGIFEDLDYFSQKVSTIDYIDLHVFSRFLPVDCFGELDGTKAQHEGQVCGDPKFREWKSFITMTDVFAVIDYMLKGKCSFIQNSLRLLNYVKRGGSLKVAAKHYETSVQKNQRRILSNVRRFIKNKEITSADRARKLGIEGYIEREFQLGLFDQISGYFNDLGMNSAIKEKKMYVIELKDFESVIECISAKYVYEKYDLQITADGSQRD